MSGSVAKVCWGISRQPWDPAKLPRPPQSEGWGPAASVLPATFSPLCHPGLSGSGARQVRGGRHSPQGKLQWVSSSDSPGPQEGWLSPYMRGLHINSFLLNDQYPLPNPVELMANLSGGRKFTKLDLTAVYTQMVLDDESSKLIPTGDYTICLAPFWTCLSMLFSI